MYAPASFKAARRETPAGRLFSGVDFSGEIPYHRSILSSAVRCGKWSEQDSREELDYLFQEWEMEQDPEEMIRESMAPVRQAAIVTDTHCIRLVNRMGLVDGIKDPKKVEMALWKLIPAQEGSDFCHRLVYHGRDVCTARTRPHCDACCLGDICARSGI